MSCSAATDPPDGIKVQHVIHVPLLPCSNAAVSGAITTVHAAWLLLIEVWLLMQLWVRRSVNRLAAAAAFAYD